MTFGAGASRKEPLWWIITTAGDDPDRTSIGWEVHEYARKITTGEIDDPTWFAKIYGADENDDIWDESTWYKANPSLGVTISIEAVRSEAQTAKNNPAVEKNFRWLRLNQWISLKTTSWILLNYWDDTEWNWKRTDLLGKKCYLGLDLSSTFDLTSVAAVFPPQEGLSEWRYICETYIPEVNMKQRVLLDHVPYDRWVAERLLNITEGDVIDYNYIFNKILEMSQLYDVEAIGADPWNGSQLLIDLQKEDLTVLDVRQNIATMSPSMKYIETIIKNKEFTHEKSQLIRWCFGNVSIISDGNENIKPKKISKKDRIDPIVAMINAFAVAIKLHKVDNVYTKRGIRSV